MCTMARHRACNYKKIYYKLKKKLKWKSLEFRRKNLARTESVLFIRTVIKQVTSNRKIIFFSFGHNRRQDGIASLVERSTYLVCIVLDNLSLPFQYKTRPRCGSHEAGLLLLKNGINQQTIDSGYSVLLAR